MNYKLEKFWNKNEFFQKVIEAKMNYKLEKFWNMIENGQVGAFSYNEL